MHFPLYVYNYDKCSFFFILPLICRLGMVLSLKHVPASPRRTAKNRWRCSPPGVFDEAGLGWC